eukprot:TRINITY_DN4125_c0_g1_i5.p1 TRINITY_DN4125_c0_g1~~TRINITY_DN4125_c0_g1_i5.p1  ORF type:complete len:206 (-),score=-13.75 TRINITY_DN4125_c0_g1_i5:4-621(-)
MKFTKKQYDQQKYQNLTGSQNQKYYFGAGETIISFCGFYRSNLIFKKGACIESCAKQIPLRYLRIICMLKISCNSQYQEYNKIMYYRHRSYPISINPDQLLFFYYYIEFSLLSSIITTRFLIEFSLLSSIISTRFLVIVMLKQFDDLLIELLLTRIDREYPFQQTFQKFVNFTRDNLVLKIYQQYQCIFVTLNVVIMNWYKQLKT